MTEAGGRPSWKRFQKMSASGKSLNRRAVRIEKGVIKHAHKFVTSRLDRLTEVRREVIGWAVLLMILVGLSAGQWSIFRAAYTKDAPQEGGTYSEGVLGSLETLNPLFARSNAERSAARLLFASLYQYDNTGHLKGDLAKSIAINGTETEYTITLKDNLRWSDGHPLTVEDVMFTVNLLKNPKVGASTGGWSSIKVRKTADNTVTFVTPSTYAPFLHTLTFPIVPKHVLENVAPATLRDHSFGRSPVTSGPFKFRLLQTDNRESGRKAVHMTANESYHFGKPKLDRFQLYAYASLDEITKGLRTSEIMATPELTYASQPENVKKMYDMKAYETHNGVYALFNSKSPILQSPSIRKALVQSVDITALRKKMPQQTGELTGPILPEHTEAELERPLTRDVEAAKKALDAEGWTVSGGVRKKGDQSLKLSVVSLQGSKYENAANSLAETWRNELNAEVEVKIVDATDANQDVLRSVLQPRNFDVLIYELVLGGDPDVYAYWHSSQDQRDQRGLNFANYNDAISDDALVGGRGKRSPKQRADYYQSFVRRWQASAASLPLYRPTVEYIKLPSVQAVTQNTRLVSPTDRFADVIYWTVRQDSVYKTP